MTTGSVGDPGQGNGRRILVFDDEQSIADAVATALSYEGCEAEEASTGREALSAVAALEPEIDLTATEFALLRYVMLSPRRELTKGQISQNVWNYDFGGNSSIVETFISYLRKKLKLAGAPQMIKALGAADYMLEPERR